MIKMDAQNNNVIRCLFLIPLILQFACKERNHSQTEGKMPQDSVSIISNFWKQDSSGCLRLRDPRKIVRVIKQEGLIGMDTTSIKEYLGKPNHISFLREEKYYIYWLECIGENKISYSNFYCYFRGDSLYSYRHSIY